MTEPTTETAALRSAQPRRAAIAAALGGALEYYDFVLFGLMAALVFPRIFFQDTGIAYIASFLAFGVAYLARPIGAIVLSHIGDRLGRKRSLIITISIMGASTFLIGCLPTYDAAGILAPVLLVVLRLLQGFSAGGELAGASTLTLEHAPNGRRAFTTTFALVGVGAGSVLAGLVMIPVVGLPDEQLLGWAWRIPFLISIVVLALGIYIRRGVTEPEIFIEEKQKQEKAKASIPIVEAFRFNWQGIIRVAGANLYTVVNSIVTVFSLAFAVNAGVDRATMVLVATAGQAVCIFVRPLGGMLGDRIGRKPVFITGVVGSALLLIPYFMAIEAGNIPGIFIVNILLLGVLCGLGDGVYPAFYGEMFSARVRFTGMAVGLQIGIVIAGFAPSIASSLQGDDLSVWVPVAVFVLICAAIAVIAAATARDEFRTPLDQLGLTPQMRRQLAREEAEAQAEAKDDASPSAPASDPVEQTR